MRGLHAAGLGCWIFAVVALLSSGLAEAGTDNAGLSCPPLKYDALVRFKQYAPDPSIALMQAVFREDESAVTAALRADADVNRAHDRRDFVCWIDGSPVAEWKTPQWTYPLYQAAQESFNPRITKLLLAAGASVTAHPYDLDPLYADRRDAVIRLPWSLYGKSKGSGASERDWAPVMAEFVQQGFVMSGEVLSTKVPLADREIGYQMLSPVEKARFDAKVSTEDRMKQKRALAEEQARSLAARQPQMPAPVPSPTEVASTGGGELSNAIGKLACKTGTLSTRVCLSGGTICQAYALPGTLYGYIEGASPDRQRLQILVAGGLLPRSHQADVPLFRGINFDGFDYRQGQLIWSPAREWSLCDISTAQGTLR